ncbi:barstar family protein [Gordonia sp. (in: high G+C Gram-positive bacteria)]|uniref:barstar family protein n=1 Tax=Gordonia sp. (in: high G+C Gram-positive bacteria) TaxID=84139 RepID=UPI003C728EF4
MSAVLPPDLLTGPGPAVALAVGDIDTYGCGAVVRRLPGAQMRTLAGLYEVFAESWRFPTHFGHNKDAFDDVVGDLPVGLRTAAGAPATGFLTVIDDADQLLADADPNDFEWFADSGTHWRERQARNGLGFGIVLVVPTEAAASAVAARWEAADAPLIRLRQD